MLSDTHPKIKAMQLDMLRQIPSWRKAHMLGQMYQTTKQLTLAGLRHRYPNASEPELRRRLATLLLGPELAEIAFGSLVDTGAERVD
jgi:hypothetical protein